MRASPHAPQRWCALVTPLPLRLRVLRCPGRGARPSPAAVTGTRKKPPGAPPAQAAAGQVADQGPEPPRFRRSASSSAPAAKVAPPPMGWLLPPFNRLPAASEYLTMNSCVIFPLFVSRKRHFPERGRLYGAAGC